MTEDYVKRGFLPNLERPFPQASSANKPLLSEEEFNRLVEGVSGSKITSGVSRSPSGDFQIDWDNSLLKMLEGAEEVVLIGKFEDGTKGIRIKSGKGTDISLANLELKSTAVDVKPGGPNTVKLYVDNKGTGGKNRLVAQFTGGVVRVLATQP